MSINYKARFYSFNNGKVQNVTNRILSKISYRNFINPDAIKHLDKKYNELIKHVVSEYKLPRYGTTAYAVLDTIRIKYLRAKGNIKNKPGKNTGFNISIKFLAYFFSLPTQTLNISTRSIGLSRPSRFTCAIVSTTSIPSTTFANIVYWESREGRRFKQM